MQPVSRGKPDACSRRWDDAALPATGTASQASFWIAVEQPGAWPAKAVDMLAGAVESACASAGGRVLLIRRPGRHPDHEGAHPSPDGSAARERTAYLAGGLATRSPWLVGISFTGDAGVLCELPLDGMNDATPARVLDALPDGAREVGTPQALLLVCTNGRRDVCCATRGREIALDADQARPGLVWECTHTGGHRFAPTAVLLPYGVTYARLDADSAVAALDAGQRGEIPDHLNSPIHDRGSSWLPAAGQARESAVRQTISENSLTALQVRGDVVTHADGRSWRVDVEPLHGPDLPASCGKRPAPSTWWRLVAITELSPAAPR